MNARLCAVLPGRTCCLPNLRRAQAQNNEATLAETLQKTTTQVSSELVELCCENHALSCENHELMQVKRAAAGAASGMACQRGKKGSGSSGCSYQA